MQTTHDRKQQTRKRLESQGRRITALTAQASAPGSAASSGFSNQVGAIHDRHRATSSEFVRLTSLPDDDDDWDRLHDRLEKALDGLDTELDELEKRAAPSNDRDAAK